MIAPIEIENKEFKKVLRGYREEEVDEFLDLVKEDYEKLCRDNTDLKEKVRLYQEQMNKYENIEQTLNATLITAQSAASDICNAANKKSKITVEEAELKARQIVEEAELKARQIREKAHNDVIAVKQEYASIVKEFKLFREKFKLLLRDEIKSIDEIFYDIDKENSNFENNGIYNTENEAAVSTLE